MNYLRTSLSIGLLLIITAWGPHPEGKWEKLSVGDGSSHTMGDLAFFQKQGECNGRKGLLIKVVNKGKEEVKVSWRHAFLLDNGWRKGERRTVTVGSGSSIKGNCKKEDPKLWVPYPEQGKAVHSLRDIQIQ